MAHRYDGEGSSSLFEAPEWLKTLGKAIVDVPKEMLGALHINAFEDEDKLRSEDQVSKEEMKRRLRVLFPGN
jgi:hypothetical protein